MDEGGADDESACSRTAKTCGPDAPTLASSLRSDPRNDGGKKADHRGEHGISRKPLRAGMSGVFRWLAVNTRVHTCYPMRTRGCGCIGRPAFPTPSVFRGETISKPRTHRAARSRSRVNARRPSSRRTGYPACAGYDGSFAGMTGISRDRGPRIIEPVTIWLISRKHHDASRIRVAR